MLVEISASSLPPASGVWAPLSDGLSIRDPVLPEGYYERSPDRRLCPPDVGYDRQYDLSAAAQSPTEVVRGSAERSKRSHSGRPPSVRLSASSLRPGWSVRNLTPANTQHAEPAHPGHSRQSVPIIERRRFWIFTAFVTEGNKPPNRWRGGHGRRRRGPGAGRGVAGTLS